MGIVIQGYEDSHPVPDPPVAIGVCQPTALADGDVVDLVYVWSRHIDPNGAAIRPVVKLMHHGARWAAHVEFDVDAYVDACRRDDRNRELDFIEREEAPAGLDQDAWRAALSEIAGELRTVGTRNLAAAIRTYVGTVDGKRRADRAKAAAMADLCRPIVPKKGAKG